MPYVLDTNVICDVERLRPNPNLIAWLHDVDLSEIIVPLSVVFEIQYGIELARQCHPERAAQKERWFKRMLHARDFKIGRPSPAEARLRARMFATSALKNFLVQCPYSTKLKTGEDISIAASAIARGAALVTFNDTDFRLIHEHFPLPGLFHPGRLEWIVLPGFQRRRLITRNLAIVQASAPLTISHTNGPRWGPAAEARISRVSPRSPSAKRESLLARVPRQA